MSEQKYTVDARGEQCPIPVVKTKKVLDSIQGNAEITVLVDNETAGIGLKLSFVSQALSSITDDI